MTTDPVTLSDIAASIEELKTSSARTDASIGQLQTSVGQLQASASKTDAALADINVSIADLSSSITDMGTMTIEAIEASENRLRVEFHHAIDAAFGKLDKRIAALEIAQRETNERLERMEGRQEAMEADTKELYEMIAELRKDFKRFTDDERRRYRNLVSWARKVAVKTGIPFQA